MKSPLRWAMFVAVSRVYPPAVTSAFPAADQIARIKSFSVPSAENTSSDTIWRLCGGSETLLGEVQVREVRVPREKLSDEVAEGWDGVRHAHVYHAVSFCLVPRSASRTRTLVRAPWAQAQGCPACTDARHDGIHNLERKACAVLYASAVRVRARIAHILQELIDKVTRSRRAPRRHRTPRA